MATLLKPFKFGWGALNRALNEIVSAINSNAPLEGDGIQLDEKGQQGVSINATKRGGDQTGNADTAGGGGGTSAASGEYTVVLNGVYWVNVIVVDPATCIQSTLVVLAQGTGSVTFDATLTPVTPSS